MRNWCSFDDLVERIVSGVRAMEAEAGREVEAWALLPRAMLARRRSDGGRHGQRAAVEGSFAPAALRERIGLPVATVNDGSAAAFGELHFGAGRGLSRLALLTLGTGVGGGIAIDGRLVTGDDGVPPELGAMVLDDAPAGARTLEDFASASGFAAAYRRAGGDGTLAPIEIFANAAEGQAIAICRNRCGRP